MLDKFLAEILGTFVFLSIIIISVNLTKNNQNILAWLKIGLGLSIAILLVGSISGAHLNPAVSFMFYLNNEISLQTVFIYVVAQLIGASLAFFYYNATKKYYV
jgi:glycerol uptake facilitator-like aquaporin